MDELQQVYYLKAEHVQTMSGMMFADYHSGADVSDWVHTFTEFDLRSSEHSEVSMMLRANSK